MLKLLRFHYRRLFLRASLYVCMGVMMVPIILTIIIMGISSQSGDRASVYSIFSAILAFSNCSTLVIVFTSIFACEDYARGTAKTIFSMGYPRYKLFFSKFIVSTTAAAMMYAIVLLFALTGGLIFGSSGASSSRLYDTGEPDLLITIIQQFFIIIGAHAFYFMIAELLGKTGLAIVMNFFGPGIISTVFMVSVLIANLLFGANSKGIAESVTNIYMYFSAYWIQSDPSLISSIVSGFATADPLISIFVNIGYVLLFGGLALLITNKKQIK